MPFHYFVELHPVEMNEHNRVFAIDEQFVFYHHPLTFMLVPGRHIATLVPDNKNVFKYNRHGVEISLVLTKAHTFIHLHSVVAYVCPPFQCRQPATRSSY